MALQVKNFLMRITVSVLVSLVIGCSPSTDVGGDTFQTGPVTPSQTYPGQQAEIESNTATISVLPTVTDDHSVTIVAPTATTKATQTSTPTPELTPTREPEAPGGTLFIKSFDEGFLRVSLETGEVETLVPKEEDWLLWRFAVSPDQRRVAYWIHTSQTSELWLSSLTEWSPEVLLSLSDLEHDAANLWWPSNDYLLLEPGISDHRYNLFVPAHAYIINVHQKQVEVEDTGFAFGCLLAPSPRTEEVATWCPAKESWIDVQSYYTAPTSYYAVIEEAGFLWTTTEPPVVILAQLKTPDNTWAWSHDRSLVAFPLYDSEKGRDLLHFVERSTLASFLIDQQDVRYYSALDWSPDNRYITYFGTCATYACNLITDLASREVIWTSQVIPGLQNGTYLAWAHDSRHIALQFEGITILDLRTNEIVRQLKIPSAHVLAWLP